MDVDVQKWRGRGDNPFWLLLLPLFGWLISTHPHLLDPPTGSGPASRIPLLVGCLATFFFLWYTQLRFHLLLDARALYYSSLFRQELVPLADVRSIKMQGGKLVIKTDRRKFRLALPGLSADAKSNLLAAIVRRLPEPLRAVA